jgi:predicted nuclease with TOPRIM domain
VVDDRERRRLYDALVAVLGEEQAATMMELLPPVGWGDVMRHADGVALRAEMTALRASLEGQMAELRASLEAQMAELRAELRGETAELRAELRGEMAELRGEMAELRGEMAELRGEMAELRGRVGALVPKMVLANIGLAATVFGLTLAAAKLA